MPYGFEYMLVTPDGELHDPAAFVTAVPNWSEGEARIQAAIEQLRSAVDVAARIVDGVLLLRARDLRA